MALTVVTSSSFTYVVMSPRYHLFLILKIVPTIPKIFLQDAPPIACHSKSPLSGLEVGA